MAPSCAILSGAFSLRPLSGPSPTCSSGITTMAFSGLFWETTCWSSAPPAGKSLCPSTIGPIPRRDSSRALLEWLREQRGVAHARIERCDERLIADIEGDRLFRIEPTREHFDCLYFTADLIRLSGRRYHAPKKSHQQIPTRTFRSSLPSSISSSASTPGPIEPISTANRIWASRDSAGPSSPTIPAVWSKSIVSDSPEGVPAGADLFRVRRGYCSCRQATEQRMLPSTFLCMKERIDGPVPPGNRIRRLSRRCR